jgi:nitroreductase
MELLDAIKTRRSIREFTGERIPDERTCGMGAGHEGFILDKLITTVFLEV